MKDLKFKKKLSGLGGADCIICESRKEDWKTIDKIQERFPINRFAESSIDLYEQVYMKEMVKFKRNKEITRTT